MEHISELINGLTNTLESQVRTRMTPNMPETPTAIVYAGEKAFEARDVIMETLEGVWRARAEAVCQLVIRDGGYNLPRGDGQWATLSMDEVQEQIDDMFAREHSFRSMNGLLLVLIQNTADCTELSQFTEGYLALDELKQQLGISCNTMKIVLLDESGKGRTLAREIRTWLRQSMDRSDDASRATVILSNRLKSGVLLTGKRIRENYALAGNLILLANDNNGTFRPKHSRMFPVFNPHFITASYSHDSKPNRNICEVLVDTTLSWLESRFNKGDLLSTDLMSKQLEITGGSMKSLDRFFQQNIADTLPPSQTLEYLPRAGELLDSISRLPFRDFDRVTMGSFADFYEKFVLPKCASDQLKRQFRDYFAEQLRGKFSPREAARSITPQTVEQVLNQLVRQEPAESLSAAEYVTAKAKSDYSKMVLPVCEEVLLEAGEKARGYISQITEISQEFQHSYMMDVEETVRMYYRELTLEKLNGDLGDQLLETFNRSDLTRSGMLDALDQVIKLIFTSHRIFGLAMEDEMILRLNGNANQVQASIRQELTDGLGDCIRLQTAIVPEIIFETMLVNQHKPDGEMSLFYDYLSGVFSNADCLDTGNSNAVEFVQLYAVDANTL